MLIGLLLVLGGLFLMYWGWTGLHSNTSVSSTTSSVISGITPAPNPGSDSGGGGGASGTI